ACVACPAPRRPDAPRGCQKAGFPLKSVSAAVERFRGPVRHPIGRTRAALGRAAAPVLDSLEDRRLLAATLLKDVEPSTASSNPQSLVSVGGVGYFVASDSTATATTYSLYRTDATDGGSVP